MTDLHRIKNVAMIISLEASTPSQSLEGLTDRLPGFISDVKNFVSDLFDFSKVTPPNLLDTNRLARAIRNTDYTRLMAESVYVPPGLSVTYLDYLDVLEQGMQIVEKLPSETLQPFARWISVNLTNPERLASLNSERQVEGFKAHNIEAVKDDIAKCFKGNGVNDEVTFELAFRRSADWDTAANKANALSERINSIGSKSIIELVTQITESLDTLLERIKEDPTTYRTSGNAVRVIATLCSTMADECEFYSVYRFQLMSVLTALQDTEAKLKDLK